MTSDRTTPGGRPFQRLPRAFRLKKQRLIRPLFDRGRQDVGTVERGCIRLLYRIVERHETGPGVPIQVGFTPGRGLGATDRNRIKRVLREVYRVRQQSLMDLFSDGDRALTLMILFRRPRRGDERCIRTDLPAALGALAERLKADLQ